MFQYFMQDFQTREVNTIDVEHFMRDTYAEIEYLAQFAMALQPFCQLPKDQKVYLGLTIRINNVIDIDR